MIYDVILNQFFTYNRYFLVITTRREYKPWPWLKLVLHCSLSRTSGFTVGKYYPKFKENNKKKTDSDNKDWTPFSL